MASPILELENADNWEVVYFTDVTANFFPEDKNRYYPIKPIDVPVLLDKHIIAVFPTSNSAKEWWVRAGWLSQKIFTGIIVGGNPDTKVQESRRLLLNKINLEIFPKLTNNYQLIIDVPFWFSHYNITVWKYIGIEEDSLEQLIENNESILLQIQNKLNDIESQI